MIKKRNPLLPRGRLNLTHAEQRVYNLRDKPVADIARELGLKPKTVAKYLTTAKEKLADIATLEKITGHIPAVK